MRIVIFLNLLETFFNSFGPITFIPCTRLLIKASSESIKLATLISLFLSCLRAPIPVILAPHIITVLSDRFSNKVFLFLKFIKFKYLNIYLNIL